MRRIEWIKYFVREGDLQRAFDLGWDGKPFKQAKVVEEMVGSDAAVTVSQGACTSDGKKPVSSSSVSVALPEGAPTSETSASGDPGPSSGVALHRI